MNEVSQVRLVPQVALSSSVAKSDSNRKLTDKNLAAALPAEREAVISSTQAVHSDEQKGKQLKDALGTMQDFVQNVKRELQFSVDKDLGRTVVKVVDSESGDLIRQIPEEIFLELARKVKEHGEVNLFNATG
ncbi:MAG TPA: flagellar protein FlaG [Cellvibrionaceae bacterium]|nr:flagellar protein FlaG [Cellvibrionaceae bacterium]HMY38084.1 flagellar protein FlaG [Marinagarivorans sp.]